MARRMCIPILLLTVGLVIGCAVRVPAVVSGCSEPDGDAYLAAGSEHVPASVKPAHPSEITMAHPVGDVLRFRGPAPNYEGPEVLVSRCSSFRCLLASWPGAAGLVGPPSLFLLLFGLMKMRQWRVSAEYRARVAPGRFRKTVEGLAGYRSPGPEECAQFLGAVRSFLSDKLMARTSGFTWVDFDTLLRSRGIDEHVRARLGRLWSVCERERFGGGSAIPSREWRELVDEALDVVGNVDNQVRRINET
jgi:hypothetical protein